jgi:hypothetical protein
LSRGAGFAISVLHEWQRKTIEHPSVGTRPIASPQTGHHLVIVSISRIAIPSEAAPHPRSEAFRQGLGRRLRPTALPSADWREAALRQIKRDAIPVRNAQLRRLVGEGAAIDFHRLVVNRGCSRKRTKQRASPPRATRRDMGTTAIDAVTSSRLEAMRRTRQ